MNEMTRLLCASLLLAVIGLPLAGCQDDDHAHDDDDSSAGGDGDAHDDGHGGGDAGTADAGHAHTTCGLQENCTGDEVLEADLVVAGDDGSFSVKVVAHNDLSVNMNEWTVRILDDTGEPVVGASVTASVWSVDCMHGGPTPPEELESDADGNVDVAPVAVHGGPWNAIFEISMGDTSDEVSIPLCIPGEAHGGTTSDAGAADHDTP